MSIVVGILAVLIAGDFIVRAVMQRKLSDEISNQVEADSIDTTIGGFSMIWNFATGEIPYVRISIVGAKSDGLAFPSIEILADQLTFDRSIVFGGSAPIRGRDGKAIVVVSLESLQDQLGPAKNFVELEPSGAGVDAVVDIPVVGEFRLGVGIDVRNANLIISIDDVSIRGVGVEIPDIPDVRVAIPALPPTTDLTNIRAQGDDLELTLRLGAFVISSDGTFR